ncbi:MAG TPA: hypothetical protein VJL37_07735 [Flavobacterium sp.]|nr:hypothetical protein [Flavobacterium sp.]
MRKFLLPLFLLTCLTMTSQVGVGTITPNAALDITSTNDGILVPRIALVNTTTATVATPTTSEIVYNTATVNDVTPGFYYWNGTVWVRILTGTNDFWNTTGNSGTNAATNFIGTTNSVDFITKTNNTEKMRVTSDGNVGIGTAAPASKLDVAAGVTTTNSIINATGSINDFLQFNVQNTSTAVRAQSGYSATADNGSPTTGFAWMGINNSTFNFPTAYNIGGPNDVSYVGSGQDLYIANANNTKSIIFSTGTATNPFFNERMRITNSGATGIGTSTPQGALDVVAGTNNYGFVIPRVALTASNAQSPVTNPQTGVIPAGTIVYNTATAGTAPNNVSPGLYFWNGTRWYAFAGSSGGLDWSLNGNSSTTPGSYASPGANYLGTSDNTALHLSTVGLPRMRITTNGNIGIGQSSLSSVRVGITPIATTDTALYATGTGSNSASLIATGRFENTAANYATSITSSTPSVPTLGSPNIAIRAASGSSSFISPTASTNIGVASNATNIAFYGITEGTTDTSRRAAEFRTNDTGSSTDSDANDPIAYLAGYGNNVSVDGTNTRSLKYGGYFYGGNASAYAYVGARLGTPITGNSNYKIIGPGVVSTIVSSEKQNGNKKIMFAPEAPEVLFEDYGTGKLVDGIAEIKIDPILAKNIHVDSKRPLKVFIQLEGDCNGVFVTNKSKTGFTVKELQNGKSNVEFSWHIVANRADETEANGEKTIYQSLRFPDAPEAIKPTISESKKIQSTKPDSDSEVKTENNHTPN